MVRKIVVEGVAMFAWVVELRAREEAGHRARANGPRQGVQSTREGPRQTDVRSRHVESMPPNSYSSALRGHASHTAHSTVNDMSSHRADMCSASGRIRHYIPRSHHKFELE